ncbi:MAG: C69 family dipeptidase [Bacteroidota bacterium]
MKLIYSILFSAVLILSCIHTNACTNIIVTRSASTDKSVMMTYAADSHIRYGYLFFYPTADHPAGATTDVIHYENGKLMGRIPDVPHTYNVIGLMNENQVACGETTFGGLDSLQNQPGAILDYGSLMRIALQRSKTARDAIRVMTELIEQYGYASSGESISVTDKNEAWILEIIGKGKYEKGAVWVAMRIPDGCISGHANQARITTFKFQQKNEWNNLKQEVFHSKDVISFAKAHGFYKGTDESFSFSDVYNPINFGGARFCDARVWSFFRKWNASIRESPYYTEYAMGKFYNSEKFFDGSLNPNKFVSNRLPLWIKPDKAVSLSDVMNAMRDHYEDTPLDMRDGIGAGPYHCPYRWRPMEFKIDSNTYLHERAIATQQTGYVFVAQSRDRLPDPVGGIFWFGVDDADGCVFAPMYCGIKRIPSSYAQGNGSMIQWSDSSAFWTFSMVNNFGYSKYDRIHPEVEKYQKEYETLFMNEVAALDAKAASSSESEMLEMITQFSVSRGNQLVKDWRVFFQYLFMKYMDGNLKKTEGMKLTENGNGKGIPVKPTHPGYGKEWERLMMENTGERYLAK